MATVVLGPDGRARCPWGVAPLEYLAYHDGEWGRPVRDEQRIFEKLSLEGFQSGLSWLTVLRKRPAFRQAFAGFDPQAVAAFGSSDVDRLLGDASIIRHRGKIEAVIGNARALAAMHDAGETLSGLVWGYRPDPAPAPEDTAELASVTPESTALSRDLRRRGFRFVGPTTVYAAMQSLGVVNDHLARCFARAEVASRGGT